MGAYHEICRLIKQGYAVVKDDVTPPRMGPYAYKGNQWVGFDDTAMIEQKCNYVKEMGLGGGMVWALDLDDFRNLCGEGSYPLMNDEKSSGLELSTDIPRTKQS